MRGGVLLGSLLLLGAAPGSEITQFFRYQRSVPEQGAGQTCAVIDAAIYAHAQPSLKDLRLLGRRDGGVFEVPYVLALSEAQPVASETARVVNLGQRGPRTVFDLQMPPNRAYSEVTLNLDGKDFVGTAEVSGKSSASAAPVQLGQFTVFDLSSQKLARSTTLHLAESTYPVLHVELRVQAANGGGLKEPVVVRGAAVPPSREAQTLFTVAASSDAIEQKGKESGVRFRLPARVPIERVRFVLAAGARGNFDRDVRVTAHAVGESESEVERINGRIEHVRLQRDDVAIEDEVLTVPATIGANLQNAADVEADVENGDDPPLPLRSVVLEMRRRSMCFEGLGAEPLSLFYGDPGLEAPTYDYARTFAPAPRATAIAFGPEEENRDWRERPDTRSPVARHPAIVYVALLVAVCVLAVVAFRARRSHLH